MSCGQDERSQVPGCAQKILKIQIRRRSALAPGPVRPVSDRAGLDRGYIEHYTPPGLDSHVPGCQLLLYHISLPKVLHEGFPANATAIKQDCKLRYLLASGVLIMHRLSSRYHSLAFYSPHEGKCTGTLSLFRPGFRVSRRVQCQSRLNIQRTLTY